MLEVVLRELERIFLEDSGLAEARPGVRVPVSRPAHYLELLENVQVHGYHMMRGRGRVLDNAEIAADWYDAIYAPTLAAIDRLRLGRLYRDAPPGDLFLVLHRHRRDAFPSTGCPHLAQTVVSVIGDGGRRRRLRLPGRGVVRRPSSNAASPRLSSWTSPTSCSRTTALYADAFAEQHVDIRPSRALAIVTCMDSRLERVRRRSASRKVMPTSYGTRAESSPTT